MDDCKHDDALGFDAVEHRVWKPGEDCAAHLAVNTREDVGETLYTVERGVDGCKKLFAKAVTLPVVLRVTTG